MLTKLKDKISFVVMLICKHSIKHSSSSKDDGPVLSLSHCYWFAAVLSTEATVLSEYPPASVIKRKKGGGKASPPAL